MSIIQTIRDKGARISVMLIALALIGFILTDYFSGKSRGLFRGNSGTTIGRVNGKKIGFDEFNKRVDQMEGYMKQQGYPQNAATTQQALDNTWEQEVSRVLFNEEFNNLGIRIGKKELGDILYGPNAPQDLKSQFTDPKTGQFNAIQAKQQVDLILKKGTPEQKASFNSYINDLEQQRSIDKYVALMASTINYPRWFIEKQNAENSQMAKISFVRGLYSLIPDSTIKIEDKEIEEYVNKHKDQFKQPVSRTINYVTFSAAPSAADSLEAKNRLLALKPAFDTTANLDQLLNSEGIDASYNYDGYKNLAGIQSTFKDSIVKIPVGSVYGPYLDGGNYVLAKLQGAKPMPDSVKVRHILVATVQRDQQSGQMVPVRDTATASKLIDSLRTAIAKGSNFDSLCAKFSDDPGSKDKGGVYDNFPAGQMVGAFNDFCFLNPVGAKGVVKTEFGYHYIEILSQKGSSTGYKIAFLPKEIIVSTETDQNANNQANQFAGDSRDQKSFDANFEKNLKPKGMNKGIATVSPSDGQVMGLGFSRQFVKNIYAANLGEVLKPEKIDDNYVVAVVTEIFREGTQSVAKARPSAEPPLRNQKKAAMIKQKIGKVTTLEAASAVLEGKAIETADSLRMTGSSSGQSLGFEPKITGAAFNPANKGKVIPEALEGQSGVFVVRVDSVTATPVTEGSVAEQRKGRADQRMQYVTNPQSPNYPLKALRVAATIKDNRSERY